MQENQRCTPYQMSRDIQREGVPQEKGEHNLWNAVLSQVYALLSEGVCRMDFHCNITCLKVHEFFITVPCVILFQKAKDPGVTQGLLLWHLHQWYHILSLTRFLLLSPILTFQGKEGTLF